MISFLFHLPPPSGAALKCHPRAVLLCCIFSLSLFAVQEQSSQPGLSQVVLCHPRFPHPFLMQLFVPYGCCVRGIFILCPSLCLSQLFPPKLCRLTFSSQVFQAELSTFPRGLGARLVLGVAPSVFALPAPARPAFPRNSAVPAASARLGSLCSPSELWGWILTGCAAPSASFPPPPPALPCPELTQGAAQG